MGEELQITTDETIGSPISFFLKAKDSGEIKFTWIDDLGESVTESRKNNSTVI